MSKIGVNRLTELLVDTLGKDPSKSGTLINSVSLLSPLPLDMFYSLHTYVSLPSHLQVCPGWVRTRMGTMAATRSVQQGKFHCC